MRINNSLVTTVWMFVALGSVACGSDDNTGANPATQGGTGAIGASAGATLPAAGSGTATAGSKASGAAGASTIAGRGAAGSTTGVAGTAAGSGTGAAGMSMAGTGMAAAGSGMGTTSAGGTGGAAGMAAAGSGGGPMGGSTGMMGMGAGKCCMGGDCLCHGDPPSAPTADKGPFMTAMYTVSAGCIYYPMNAEPPFAAVSVSDGFSGSGGCGSIQTGQWGPLYASWGIVAMIINTGAADQPNVRGTKLTAAIEAFKSENMKSGSPLMGKLSGRYGTSGFSMGGGGTTFSAMKDPTLKSNVSIMAWAPASSGITVPSLFIFGSADTLAGTMGMTAYRSIMGTTPKMTVTINSSHAGQPSSGGGASGRAGLAWQKVYLEGDERWKPILGMVMATDKQNVN